MPFGFMNKFSGVSISRNFARFQDTDAVVGKNRFEPVWWQGSVKCQGLQLHGRTSNAQNCAVSEGFCDCLLDAMVGFVVNRR
jgi:hypothetical protein